MNHMLGEVEAGGRLRRSGTMRALSKHGESQILMTIAIGPKVPKKKVMLPLTPYLHVSPRNYQSFSGSPEIHQLSKMNKMIPDP